MAGPEPLKGTERMPAFVRPFRISTSKSPMEPWPAVPSRTLPGLFLANSTRPLRSVNGSPFTITSTLGVRSARLTGCKSLNGS